MVLHFKSTIIYALKSSVTNTPYRCLFQLRCICDCTITHTICILTDHFIISSGNKIISQLLELSVDKTELWKWPLQSNMLRN